MSFNAEKYLGDESPEQGQRIDTCGETLVTRSVTETFKEKLFLPAAMF